MFAFSLICFIAFTIAIDSVQTTALSDLFSMGMVGALIACIVIAVWAIPVHLVLNKLKKFHLGWYILSVLIPCFGIITLELHSTHPTPVVGTAGIFFGVPASIVFWYFAAYNKAIADDRSERSAT